MIITQTPFRMSFFGGGTDMEEFFMEHGGAVLSSTFDKYCYVNVRHLPRFFDYSTELSYAKTERITNLDDIMHPAIRNAMKMLDMHEIRLTYEADLPARSGLGTSSSRNSWFSFTLAFIFYNIFMFIYCKKNGYDVVMKRIVKSILFTIAMCAIYIMFNTDSVFINRIISMGDLTGELGEPSNALRYVLWLNIIDIILDSIENFVFGIGIAVTGNSPDAIMVPESGFLKRFVEGGLLMLVLYYTMILHCFYIVLSNIKTGVSGVSRTLCKKI